MEKLRAMVNKLYSTNSVQEFKSPDNVEVAVPVTKLSGLFFNLAPLAAGGNYGGPVLAQVREELETRLAHAVK